MRFSGLDGAVVFNFGERLRIEGTTLQNKEVVLNVDEITRLDIDQESVDGDDKTHHYCYLLIEAGNRKLIYREREAERVYYPSGGYEDRIGVAKGNLRALGHLLEAAGVKRMRTTLGTANPSRHFRAEVSGGSAGPTEPPGPVTTRDLVGMLSCFGAFGLFLLLCCWFVWTRISHLF